MKKHRHKMHRVVIPWTDDTAFHEYRDWIKANGMRGYRIDFTDWDEEYGDTGVVILFANKRDATLFKMFHG